MGKINLQMYSFNDGKHNDSRANLRTAAELGYDGVELFGPNFEIPAEEMKALTEELGLSVVSMHVPNKAMIPELAPYAAAVGAHFVGLGIEPMLNDDEVHRWARELNELGAVCKKHGCMMIYHNHTQEFGPCGDVRVIDVLMRETDPELVGFELDAGWCAAAGFDPIEFVREYNGRVKLIHVKESSEVLGPMEPIDVSGFEIVDGKPVFPKEIQEMLEKADRINCAACEGLVDWAKMKEAGDACGCEAYIVEREYSEGDRVEELKRDIERYREVL